MKVFRALDGTLCSAFTIGLQGPTIWQGQTDPGPGVGRDGDLFVVQRPTGGFYKKLLGTWEPVLSPLLVTQVSALRGIDLTVSVNDTVIAVIRNPFTIDSQDTTIDSEDGSIDSDAQATTTITLSTALEGGSVVIKDDSGLAGTFPILVSAQIDGQSSQTITAPYGLLDLLYSGGEWRVVGR